MKNCAEICAAATKKLSEGPLAGNITSIKVQPDLRFNQVTVSIDLVFSLNDLPGCKQQCDRP
jgi:hypothetical protein